LDPRHPFAYALSRRAHAEKTNNKQTNDVAVRFSDTSSAHDKLMITILAGLVEFERSLILFRTSKGRVRAKARRVKFGRKPALTAHQQAEALESNTDQRFAGRKHATGNNADAARA
jgi:DNA invertase Pin-like site-specific DNA recombinase